MCHTQHTLRKTSSKICNQHKYPLTMGYHKDVSQIILDLMLNCWFSLIVVMLSYQHVTLFITWIKNFCSIWHLMIYQFATVKIII